MNHKINSYLKRVDLIVQINEILVNEILKFIANMMVVDIAGNEEELGVLFYRSVSKLNQDTCCDETERNIIAAFDNIRTMSVESQNISELRTIYFLQRIYSKRSSYIIELSQNNMEGEFKSLLENLEQIRVLFKLKSEGNIVFPISHLLFDVIKCDNLLDELNYIKTLQTLMLALQIFNSNEYNEELDCIKHIIDDCKLTFASYLLDRSERIGGRDWIKNYEKNGVLILYNPIIRKVLIRNINKEYFDLTGKEEYKTTDVKTEKNRNNEDMAYYVEYDLDSLNVVDISDELKKSNNFGHIYEILKIIVDKRYYNIWSKNFLIELGDKILPINPFGNKDKYCIKENEIELSSFEKILPFLKPYALNKLVGDGINYINLGMVLALQKIEMVEIQKLDLENTNIRFNQLIKNWLTECTEKEKCFNKFFQAYTEQLVYVDDKKVFLEKEYEGEYFIPYQVDEKIIEMLGFNVLLAEANIRICVCEEDFMNSEKKIFIKDSEKDITSYKVQRLCDDDKEELEREFIAYIDDKEEMIYIGEEVKHYYQILNKIRKINKNIISEELINTVSEFYISELLTYMRMHYKAWNEIHSKVSLDSIVRYRLINHLLLFDFNKDKFLNWYSLLKKHNIVDYSIIASSEIFDISKQGILYVLKDRSRAQSTFKYINYEYINRSVCRDKFDLFDPKIDKNSNGEYTVNGVVIQEVCFVFDVIQYAGATTRTLNYYLDKDSKEDDMHMQIYVSGKWTSLNDVVCTNKTTISVYSIYASDEGVNNVNEYLKTTGYPYREIQIEDKISSKLDKRDNQIIKDIYKRFSGEIDLGEFIIIREFNQPKHNIVNQELLLPQRVCSLFVKRKEI